MERMLANYFDLQQQIYDFFGYRDGCRVFPLADRTPYYWMLLGSMDDKVAFSNEPFTTASIEDGTKMYSDEILPGSIKRADGYTLMVVDAQSADYDSLVIYNDERECQDEALKELYEECW